MKIAYIHTGLFPSNSPSLTFTVFNAIGLAKVFDRCDFFIKKNSPKSPDQIMGDKLNLTRPQNLVIHPIKPHAFIDSNYFYYRKVYRQIKDLILNSGLNAVISRSVTFLPYLSKIKKNYNIPVFFESHDFFADLSIRPDINRSKKQRQEKLEQEYIPKISGLICLQESQKQLYQKVFPETNIYVARTGIHKVHSQPFKDRNCVAYIGSFDTHKGISTLLEAAARTKTQPSLLLIGGKDRSDINRLQFEIEKSYDLSKVTITGWVDKQTLRKHLSNTVLGIIPLTDSFFNKHLTSPLKLFDFYSYGIPVIASDLPTLRELVVENKTGLFFQPNDANDLAEKMDSLLSDPDNLKKMSRETYRTATEYLWEKRAEQILDIVKNSRDNII